MTPAELAGTVLWAAAVCGKTPWRGWARDVLAKKGYRKRRLAWRRYARALRIFQHTWDDAAGFADVVTCVKQMKFEITGIDHTQKICCHGGSILPSEIDEVEFSIDTRESSP